MTAAPEIPADVTLAARDVVVAWLETHSGSVHSSFRQQVDAGQFDDWPIYLVAARAILAERQRCVEAVNAKLAVTDGESYVGVDGPDVDYDRGIYGALRAITGASH